MILEKIIKFRGVYYVLNGRFDFLNGIILNEFNIKFLFERIVKDDIEEIILVINFNIEGEIIVMYFVKFMKNFGIKIIKLVSGIFMGGNLEFLDIVIIFCVLDDRIEI